jgi:hypothetical protein
MLKKDSLIYFYFFREITEDMNSLKPSNYQSLIYFKCIISMTFMISTPSAGMRYTY